MAHLVFVHGVNVRKNPQDDSYEEGEQRRDAAFRDIAFRGTDVTFYNPYWGEFGAPTTYQSLDLGGDQALGDLGGGGLFGDAVADIDEQSLSGSKLLACARDDFSATVNSLTVVLNEPNSEIYDPELAIELADYLLSLESNLAEEMEQSGGSRVSVPAWLSDHALTNDEQFLLRLDQEANYARGQEQVSLSIRGALAKAGWWLTDRAADVAGGAVANAARNLTPKLAVFLGDAFIYLNNESNPESPRFKIQKVVLDAIIKAAKAAKADGSPLILLGHSMGANILYDMLKSPEVIEAVEQELDAPFGADLFMTVGTQVGLFEELKLFGDKHASKPAMCEYWWHVYNEMDVLSFGASGIFEDVIQFECNTNANIINAHTAYFTSPVFQRRLNKRLGHLGIVS